MGQNDENTERGFFRRLRGGLAKTRTALASGIGNLLLGKKAIDDDVLEELETSLLRADVGVDATQRIMDALAQRVKRKQLNDTVALFEALRAELIELLRPIAKPLVVEGATPLRDIGGRCQRRRQDHDDRQTRPAIQASKASRCCSRRAIRFARPRSNS